ncbi:MAG TPA: SIMPL domain-containing protein [Candidatus Dormibacteraeota bacterium]|nr:SIMPL domain-containing protein [Candidatus Dormibacteraeota bacterium]
MRRLLAPVGIGLIGIVAAAAIVAAANRPPIIVTSPSATTSTSQIQQAILTSGDATVSKKPDLAIVGAGIDSQGSSASAAQSDLNAKASKLIARIKALGVADGDLNTTGYWIGPVYGSGGETISGFHATEQLQLKWHTVDSVGRALDAIVQEGGATNIYVTFTLNDPKPAQAEARSQAIADARSKASAMASAAGVKVGQVLQISDLSANTRTPYPFAAAASAAPTQVPVGQIDIEVSVEVDFAIA